MDHGRPQPRMSTHKSERQVLMHFMKSCPQKVKITNKKLPFDFLNLPPALRCKFFIGSTPWDVSIFSLFVVSIDFEKWEASLSATFWNLGDNLKLSHLQTSGLTLSTKKLGDTMGKNRLWDHYKWCHPSRGYPCLWSY